MSISSDLHNDDMDVDMSMAEDPTPPEPRPARPPSGFRSSARGTRKIRTAMSNSSCEDEDSTSGIISVGHTDVAETVPRWRAAGGYRPSEELLQAFSGSCSLSLRDKHRPVGSYGLRGSVEECSSVSNSSFLSGGADGLEDADASMNSSLLSTPPARSRGRQGSSPSMQWGSRCDDHIISGSPRWLKRPERSRSVSIDSPSKPHTSEETEHTQDAKSFTSAECYGESDLCLPPPPAKSDVTGMACPNSVPMEVKTGRYLTVFPADGSPAMLSDAGEHGNGNNTSPGAGSGETFKMNGCASPSSSASMVGSPALSAVDSPEPAMSPVGFFTTTNSPGPMGRPRSGSQSPYRRTYTSPSTVQLRQSVLGKRKPDDMDDFKDNLSKRLCGSPRTSNSVHSPNGSDLGD